MVAVRLKGVNTVCKRLKDVSIQIHYYRRATKTKLPGEPGSTEFVTRLNELNAQMATPSAPHVKRGSVAALIDHYKSANDFTSLSPKTRRDYGRYLEVIREEWGPNPVSALDREAVFNLRDAFQETPRTANYVVSVLWLLLTFAVDRPKVYGLASNPAARPKKLKTGDGHRPWEEWEIAAFRAHWRLGTLERTAFEIALNTGQRGEDIVAMKRAHIGADGIAVAQEKTDARVWVPISADLMAALAAWDDGRERPSDNGTVALAPRRMLITSAKDRALKIDHFRHVMIAAYKAVGSLTVGLDGAGITTHGLRCTAATILHELACDWETIAAITGHETVQMVRKYTDRKRRARLAIERFDAARRNPE